MTLAWRPMAEADLAAVVALADRLHPHHPESAAVLAERLALAPTGCRVLAAAGGVAGYAISHPWTGDAPPPLDALLGALPVAPGAWHVHDVALTPEARGAGHATAVLRALLAVAPLPRATLVAMPGTGAYWARHGFRDTPAADAAALGSYGEGARFMLRERVEAAATRG